LVAIPLMVLMPEILGIWLKEVPEGVALFSRLMILACMIGQLTQGLLYANQALGNIKWFSIFVSSARILALPVSVIFLKMGYPSYVAIIVFVIFEALGTLCRPYILSRISDFKVRDFLKMLWEILLPTLLSVIFCALLHGRIHNKWIEIIVVFCVSACVYLGTLYLTGLTKQERISINDMKNSFLHKFKNHGK